MRFTLTMFGGSLAFIVLAHIVFGDGAMTTLGVFWLVISFPLVGYYWITRVIRRAWRDGARHDELPG